MPHIFWCLAVALGKNRALAWIQALSLKRHCFLKLIWWCFALKVFHHKVHFSWCRETYTVPALILGSWHKGQPVINILQLLLKGAGSTFQTPQLQICDLQVKYEGMDMQVRQLCSYLPFVPLFPPCLSTSPSTQPQGSQGNIPWEMLPRKILGTYGKFPIRKTYVHFPIKI